METHIVIASIPVQETIANMYLRSMGNTILQTSL